MKRHLSPLLAAAVGISIAHAQKVGDAVTTATFKKLEWIQGEAPAEWETGKLYAIECWATWCGPCLVAIPHVDALHDKYAAKGLRVIGVDVWEDGKDKVADFVKQKGDGMSYPVAYTGKKGAFETEWLIPADVQGIPHTFLVQDGKVIARIHPAKLTETVVEALLEGGETGKSALAGLNAEEVRDGAELKARLDYSTASKNGEAAGMSAAVEELRKIDPKHLLIPLMENEILVVKADWRELDRKLLATDDARMPVMEISALGAKLSSVHEVPQATLKNFLAAFDATPGITAAGPFPLVMASRLSWLADDKVKSAAYAKGALESAKSPRFASIGTEPFAKFAAAVEGGAIPSPQEFAGWINEAIQPKSPAATDGKAAGSR